MCNPSHLTVLDGDILAADIGVAQEALDTLRKHCNIALHSALSINLVKPLEALADIIIGASERLALFALSCKQLECFVYISTSYANAHLHYPTRSDSPFETRVRETLYGVEGSELEAEIEVEHQNAASASASHIKIPPWTRPKTETESESAQDEWKAIQQSGSGPLYAAHAHKFPFAYAYAKNLTERLLASFFDAVDGGDTCRPRKLLIARPSIVAPAQHFPYTGFSVPTSTPTTIVAAALALRPQYSFAIASRAADAALQASLDAVPVDVVADRALVHAAGGTRGCVHAVSGVRARMALPEWWAAAMGVRRVPWGLGVRWVSVPVRACVGGADAGAGAIGYGGWTWEDSRQDAIARVYGVLGASFAFEEGRTVQLARELLLGVGVGGGLDGKDRLQLFTEPELARRILANEQGTRYVMDKMARRSWWAWLVYKLFYSVG
ncbi:male sterility protein-domain-containing protein [Aspergillus multicolor]|uniref:male sterility protein-domain-containing protein n=1 Tax=Aspergillus multicolor TaxID=41759 RepID=UPI003CCE099F